MVDFLSANIAKSDGIWHRNGLAAEHKGHAFHALEVALQTESSSQTTGFAESNKAWRCGGK
eukprot:3483504-Pleurochrysis_carterae.AAC.1